MHPKNSRGWIPTYRYILLYILSIQSADETSDWLVTSRFSLDLKSEIMNHNGVKIIIFKQISSIAFWKYGNLQNPIK